MPVDLGESAKFSSLMAYTNFDWKPAFLAALREVPVLRHGCDVTGVDRSTVLKNRHADPEFDKARREVDPNLNEDEE